MFFSAKQIGFNKVLDVEKRIQARLYIDQSRVNELMHLRWAERFDYFMKTCAKHQEVWTAWKGDELFIFHWDGKDELTWEPFSTPLFPHKEVAEHFFKEYEEIDFTPVPIDDFIDEILSPMEKEKIKCCVFPSQYQEETIVINVGDFVVDISGCWEEIYERELALDPAIREAFIDYSLRLLEKRQMKGRPVGKLP